ncbi:DUF2867 domain-containing protein [Kitasatospora sp. NPDC001527]|uniref:DUF2867 domain-containing protein n=1 Tax=Kitasatospora sp. NPDC001527 TaxID=3154519 RepID=UPI0033275B68
MRLPRSAHTRRPWRVHEFAPDFRTEDVWAFRTPGAGPEDFDVMLAAMRAGGGSARQSRATRFLFAVRWKLGALLGWDGAAAGLGTRVRSLRERLPRELADTVDTGEPDGLPFTPAYRLPDEDVRELANRTVHTLMHLGWAPTGDGGHELRMAVLVKPNGLLGRCYLLLIAPLRHLIVYPAVTRQWEQAWRDRRLLLADGAGPVGSRRSGGAGGS